MQCSLLGGSTDFDGQAAARCSHTTRELVRDRDGSAKRPRAAHVARHTERMAQGIRRAWLSFGFFVALIAGCEASLPALSNLCSTQTNAILASWHVTLCWTLEIRRAEPVTEPSCPRYHRKSVKQLKVRCRRCRPRQSVHSSSSSNRKVCAGSGRGMV